MKLFFSICSIVLYSCRTKFTSEALFKSTTSEEVYKQAEGITEEHLMKVAGQILSE
jgi:hypothetical protein